MRRSGVPASRWPIVLAGVPVIAAVASLSASDGWFAVGTLVLVTFTVVVPVVFGWISLRARSIRVRQARPIAFALTGDGFAVAPVPAPAWRATSAITTAALQAALLSLAWRNGGDSSSALVALTAGGTSLPELTPRGRVQLAALAHRYGLVNPQAKDSTGRD
jgi:hypothetical protein